ncbi:hypothetical protein ID866_839 [Astraeus odoratus]|nr:hypothetical protein ID866_839 [Astraeus odoratus]
MYATLPPTDHRRLVMSTWHVLEQTPPPTLREILAAYKAKGDGDRDTLLAMLNAKTAEDQRLAAVASLHRTLLELSAFDPKHTLSSQPLPAPSYFDHNPRYSPYPSTTRHHPLARDSHHQAQPASKRRRSSRSPSSHPETRPSYPPSHDFPPSPYSSSRSASEEYSPRSRASMAIGSLLSSGPARDTVSDDTQNSDQPRISS